MPTCRQVAEAASYHIDGDAGPLVHRAKIVVHLLRCPSCRTFVAQLRLTRDALGHLAFEDEPLDLSLLCEMFRAESRP